MRPAGTTELVGISEKDVRNPYVTSQNCNLKKKIDLVLLGNGSYVVVNKDDTCFEGHHYAWHVRVLIFSPQLSLIIPGAQDVLS